MTQTKTMRKSLSPLSQDHDMIYSQKSSKGLSDPFTPRQQLGDRNVTAAASPFSKLAEVDSDTELTRSDPSSDVKAIIKKHELKSSDGMKDKESRDDSNSPKMKSIASKAIELDLNDRNERLLEPDVVHSNETLPATIESDQLEILVESMILLRADVEDTVNKIGSGSMTTEAFTFKPIRMDEEDSGNAKHDFIKVDGNLISAAEDWVSISGTTNGSRGKGYSFHRSADQSLNRNSTERHNNTKSLNNFRMKSNGVSKKSLRRLLSSTNSSNQIRNSQTNKRSVRGNTSMKLNDLPMHSNNVCENRQLSLLKTETKLVSEDKHSIHYNEMIAFSALQKQNDNIWKVRYLQLLYSILLSERKGHNDRKALNAPLNHLDEYYLKMLAVTDGNESEGDSRSSEELFTTPSDGDVSDPCWSCPSKSFDVKCDKYTVESVASSRGNPQCPDPNIFLDAQIEPSTVSVTNQLQGVRNFEGIEDVDRGSDIQSSTMKSKESKNSKRNSPQSVTNMSVNSKAAFTNETIEFKTNGSDNEEMKNSHHQSAEGINVVNESDKNNDLGNLTPPHDSTISTIVQSQRRSRKQHIRTDIWNMIFGITPPSLDAENPLLNAASTSSIRTVTDNEEKRNQFPSIVDNSFKLGLEQKSSSNVTENLTKTGNEKRNENLTNASSGIDDGTISKSRFDHQQVTLQEPLDDVQNETSSTVVYNNKEVHDLGKPLLASKTYKQDQSIADLITITFSQDGLQSSIEASFDDDSKTISTVTNTVRRQSS